MPAKIEHSCCVKDLIKELEEHGNDPRKLPSWMFEGLLFYTYLQLADDGTLTNKDLDFKTKQAYDTARFAGARLTNDLEEGVTHVLVGEDRSTTKVLRHRISEYEAEFVLGACLLTWI